MPGSRSGVKGFHRPHAAPPGVKCPGAPPGPGSSSCSQVRIPGPYLLPQRLSPEAQKGQPPALGHTAMGPESLGLLFPVASFLCTPPLLPGLSQEKILGLRTPEVLGGAGLGVPMPLAQLYPSFQGQLLGCLL